MKVEEKSIDSFIENKASKSKPMQQTSSSVSPSRVVSPSPKKGYEVSRHNMEVNYESNSTELYACIEKKNWGEVIKRCRDFPNEAAIVVYREDTNTKKIRWKHLPLHAALIFSAPAQVISSLIEANPNAVYSHDERGMLPCHLAFRNDAKEEVINYLFKAYPECMFVNDKKGRTPMSLLKLKNKLKEENPLRYYLLQNLLNTKKTPGQAEVQAHDEEMWNSKMMQMKNRHEEEIKNLQDENQTKIRKLYSRQEDQIEDLEMTFERKDEKYRNQIQLITQDLNFTNGLLQEARKKINTQEKQIITIEEDNERSKNLSNRISKDKDDFQTLIDLGKAEKLGMKIEYDKKIQQLDDKNDSLACKLTKIQRQTEKLKEALYTTEVNKDEIKKGYDEQVEQVKLLKQKEQELKEVKKKLNAQDNTIKALQEENQHSKEKIVLMARDKDDIQTLIDLEKAEKLGMKVEQDSKIQEMTEEHETMKNNIEILKNEKQQLKEGVVTLKSKTEEMMKVYDKKIQEMEEKEKHHLNSLLIEQTEKNEKIESLELRMKRTTEAYQYAKTEFQEKEDQIEELTSATEILLKEVTLLQEESSKERNTIQNLTTRLAKASLQEQEHTDRFKSVTDNLVKRSVEKRSMIEKYENDIRVLQSENRRLKVQLSEK